MWAYEYTSPTPDELAVRRQQLNAAGKAGLAPFLILVPVFLLRLLRQRSRAGQKSRHSEPPSPLQVQLRRVKWLLDTTYIPEFGPLLVQVLGLLHFGWLLFLASRNTSNDYMHLTKALGHVAVSQLPLQYLLAYKAHDSPVRRITGLTHERLNAYHRLLGRIVHVLLASHAILYLKFFIDKDLLAKRIKDRDVRLGVIAFWSFNILGLLAIPPIRKTAYHTLFYQSHVILTALILVVIWFHVPYTRVYVGLAAFFWLANGLTRFNQTHSSVDAQVIEAGKDLLKVKLRLSGNSLLKSWVPGQHAYLRLPGSGAIAERRNPFTIADVDTDASQITLIVRRLSGTTSALANLQKQASPPALKLEGPYGEASEYLPGILSLGKGAGQILLVAGGVGATYTLPIYLALLRTRGDSSGVKMLWFVKEAEDAFWSHELLNKVEQSLDIDIFATQAKRQIISSAFPDLQGVAVHQLGKRPDLATALEPVFAINDQTAGGANDKRHARSQERSFDPLTVMVCGPPGLSQSLRREVGKHVLGYGKDVRWYEEQFGFGGS